MSFSDLPHCQQLAIKGLLRFMKHCEYPPVSSVQNHVSKLSNLSNIITFNTENFLGRFTEHCKKCVKIGMAPAISSLEVYFVSAC